VEFLEAAKRALARLTDDEAGRARFVVIGDTPRGSLPTISPSAESSPIRSASTRASTSSASRRTGPSRRRFRRRVVPTVHADPLPGGGHRVDGHGKAVIASTWRRGDMVEDGIKGRSSGLASDVDELARR